MRERELCIDKLRATIGELEKTNSFLEQQVLEYKTQIKSLNLSSREGDKETDKQILSLNEEISKLKLELEKQIELKAKEVVKQDFTSVNMQQVNEELKVAVESLKKKLGDSLSRQNELEHEKLQANLDWQRKYQYLEGIKAKDSEEFTKQILQSRDQVNIEIISIH